MTSDTPVVLIGYRGTGKTTVARLLAERLQWPWFDADVELERVAGRSIREIFADEGESGFRDREEQIVAQLVTRGAAPVVTRILTTTKTREQLLAGKVAAAQLYAWLAWLHTRTQRWT